MRKLSILVLLAFLATPAFCLPTGYGPTNAPATDVIWIAVGNQAVAVAAAQVPNTGMVTICYYGVTMTVRERIAARYLRIGATCGACIEQGPQGPPGPRQGPPGSQGPQGPPVRRAALNGGGVCGGENGTLNSIAPKSAGVEKVIQLGKSEK